MIGRLLAAAGRALNAQVHEDLAELRLRVIVLEGITDSLEAELADTSSIAAEFHTGPSRRPA